MDGHALLQWLTVLDSLSYYDLFRVAPRCRRVAAARFSEHAFLVFLIFLVSPVFLLFPLFSLSGVHLRGRRHDPGRPRRQRVDLGRRRRTGFAPDSPVHTPCTP